MINYELYIGVFWHELAITVVLPFRAVSRAATSRYIANTLSFLAIACIRNMNMIKQTLDTSTVPVQRNCNIFLKLHRNLKVQQYCLHLLQATYPSNIHHSKDNLVLCTLKPFSSLVSLRMSDKPFFFFTTYLAMVSARPGKSGES